MTHAKERKGERKENKIVVPGRPTRYLNYIQVLVQVPPLKASEVTTINTMCKTMMI